jgi:predicted ABC-class ATPase
MVGFEGSARIPIERAEGIGANPLSALVDFLRGIDGRGYKAYKGLRGLWTFPDYEFHVGHVQGDPFAAPTRVRVVLPPETAALDDEVLSSRSRRLGVAWLLARRFHESAGRIMVRRGSGKSGVIEIESPGQEVLAQTAVIIQQEGTVETRFRVGLPARGRRASGHEAIALLTEDIPAIVDQSLRAGSVGREDILRCARTNEDADALRVALNTRGWVSFVCDGARLARRSGVDDRPLLGAAAVPFAAPKELKAEVQLPNAGLIAGMAIPRGVTLIVGGGYHGKSTLLRAIERGVYNHAFGDGRESVVTDPLAVKIRAEDGRSVAGVDISTFIGELPGGQGTRAFSTPNASGSTSQAAALVEALEAGATTLLIDEDTAATNFMIRDRRMQALVPKEAEPITPLVDRVRSLWETRGISSVIVLGGSGDYLDVADTVVSMKEFCPFDVTAAARLVASEFPTGRQVEVSGPIAAFRQRLPNPTSVDPSTARREAEVKAFKGASIVFGKETIQLSGVTQIVSRAQTLALGRGLLVARTRFMDGRRSVSEILTLVMRMIEENGLDELDDRKVGDLAQFRRTELAAALNRLRTLEVSSAEAADAGQ